MFKQKLTFVLLFLLVLAAITPASAWTAPTRMQMVDDAIKLMPRTLRTLLRTHHKAVLRGALEPLTTEGQAGHTPETLPGKAEQLSDELILAVNNQQPFAEVATSFGRLCHTIADAGYPPLAAGEKGRKHYKHFASFVEERLEKFPLVFYGHQEAASLRFDRAAQVRTVLARAALDDARLEHTYAQAGDPPSARFFDDRSVPFAVGSLAYSRSVTDIVRSWLDAWSRANGDMGRTPYLQQNSPSLDR